MEFAAGITVVRRRRPEIPSPSNPETTIPGNWADAASIDLPGAYLGPASGNAIPDSSRSQIDETRSLYLTDTSADVQTGDQIISGRVYYVREIPDAVRNPFTGWTPVLEVPLYHTEG